MFTPDQIENARQACIPSDSVEDIVSMATGAPMREMVSSHMRDNWYLEDNIPYKDFMAIDPMEVMKHYEKKGGFIRSPDLGRDHPVHEMGDYRDDEIDKMCYTTAYMNINYPKTVGFTYPQLVEWEMKKRKTVYKNISDYVKSIIIPQLRDIKRMKVVLE